VAVLGESGAWKKAWRIRQNGLKMNFTCPALRLPTRGPLMLPRACLGFCVVGLLAAGLELNRAPAADPKARPVDFAREVRPILAKNCFACHGPDEAQRKAKLRLDERESAVQVRKKGKAAIVPGDVERSLLIERVTSDDDAFKMPPPQTGHELTREQIDTLKRWVKEGAAYAPHWAYVKPKTPTIPAFRRESKTSGWPRNPIDNFILTALLEAGLQPNDEADRYTLLRRVSLDLRGLPPSPEEIAQFEKDASPEAYEHAVDRFLNDTAFGERWARMWLDLARYADSAGYGSDPLRPHIWRYRDWVIDAFNRNLPFDQLTIQQIAGDLLPNATLEQKMATAFHRNTMTNTEGGTDDEEFRVAAVKDRVDTTMQVWMGLTMGCAKCHSHKYEPITHQEYYRFFAIFNQTADNDQPNESPTMPAPTPAMTEKNRQIDAQIAPLKQKFEKPPASVVAAWVLQRSFTPPPELLATRVEIAKLEKTRPAVPNLPVMVELSADKRRETHLMIKGNFLNKGEKVEPGVPAALHALPAPPAAAGSPDRLGLARWLVSSDNPLTPRVAVNRFWAQLFGAGIVETEEDFGTQGELPSHPELLDWLAIEFMRGAADLNSLTPTVREGSPRDTDNPSLTVGVSGRTPGGPPDKTPWDIKALLRLIVTSATYRQSSKVMSEKLAKDPRNRLLSRGPRFRLEAEMVRDQALALSGLLSRKLGGPSVYPPQPPGLWQAAFNGERTWATSTGEDRYRRGLYTFWRRTIPYPSMATFDAPSRETCSVRRIRTNTPLQAFVTMNDPVYVECSQALARRIIRHAALNPPEANAPGSPAEAHARFALRLCLCRPPQEEQVKQVLALYETELAHYRKDAAAATKLATDPLGPLPAGMDAAEAAAWTVVANVLLNLDGVMVKG
jgi:mono/diheme cytochrome c family protein